MSDPLTQWESQLSAIPRCVCRHTKKNHRLYCEVIIGWMDDPLDRPIYCPCTGFTDWKADDE